MDLPSHLNAKHDAVFHSFFFFFRLSNSPRQSFWEPPRITVTAETSQAVLDKFLCHHMPLEGLIVKDYLILFVHIHTRLIKNKDSQLQDVTVQKKNVHC